MKRTVSQLRSAGYIVQASTAAIGCTDVVSTSPFWFFNPRHSALESTPERILDIVEPARTDSGQFRLTAAGEFDGEAPFPFVILNEAALRALQLVQARVQGAQDAIATATAQFNRGRNDLRDLLAA